MDIASMVRNVYEVMRSDSDVSFNVDLIHKKIRDRNNFDLTEDTIVQCLDFLRRMRIIDETSESGQMFKLTTVGLNVPTELVEKTIRIYMERNMCQDSRVFRV
jgi:hypothetical protein